MTHRVLIVEDSPVQRELLHDDLVAAGYEVRVASNGRDALEQAAEERPDVVVTDVMMPEVDGYELCRRLKADRDLVDVPVVLLTSLREPVDIVRGLECGADNFVTKPYELDQLLHRLDTVLRSRDLRSAGRFRMGVEVLVLGHTFTVSAERQQILDMLMSSFEELVHANDRLREREEQLEDVRDQLSTQVALSDERRALLEEGQDQLRGTLDQTGVAIWKVRLPGGPFEWSDNAHAVLGIDPETDITDLETWFGMIVDEDRAWLDELIANILSDPTVELPEEWTYRLVGRDGAHRTFSARGIATSRDEDSVVVSGITMDITPRRQLEERLRTREETLQGLLDASPDGILVTELDGRVRFASEAVEEIFGVRPDALIDHHLFDYLHADDEVQFRRLLESAGKGEVHTLRVRVHHTGGRVLTVDARMRPLLGPDGRTESYMAILRDVTAQAELEADLAQARDEAEAANRAKSEYLSRMSHELRTPMNSVLGFSQLLALSDLDDEERDSVERILSAGRHLLHLIDDVLDIARIEAGSMTVSIEPVSVGSVVSSAVELVRPQLDERSLTLTVATDSCADQYVEADHQRLSQVLINLLSNAAKYNRDRGSVHIECTTPVPGWRRITVSDTGPGFSRQERERLFVPFDRLGADRTDVSGTGLGLALCASLMEAMGGRIACDSTPGEGSSFWVDLPSTNALREQDGVVSSATTGGRTPEASSATILYVEDNELNLELVTQALAARPGTQLLHATSGEEGIEVAEGAQPDLVLLDLHLPGISGREVLRRLRRSPDTAELPVVIVSADATTTSTTELLAAGADAYLTKPLDLRQLRATVDELLQLRQTSTDAMDVTRADGEG